MDLNALIQNASATLVTAAWKVAGAVALWLVGRWLISFTLNLVGAAFSRQQFDVTLTRYMQTALKIVLTVALIVAILGFFGVETTTFARSSRPAAWPSASRGAACSPISRLERS